MTDEQLLWFPYLPCWLALASSTFHICHMLHVFNASCTSRFEERQDSLSIGSDECWHCHYGFYVLRLSQTWLAILATEVLLSRPLGSSASHLFRNSHLRQSKPESSSYLDCLVLSCPVLCRRSSSTPQILDLSYSW